MGYKLYTTSSKAWDAMLEEIINAKKSIYLEMYAFLDDTEHDFIGRLKEKSEQGVKVIIVADALGSMEIKSKTIELLRKSGVEFLFFSNWLRRIHRKILIVDEKIAFVGGINIGKRFKHWKDLQLKIRGKRIVRPIIKSFTYTYEMSGGKNKSVINCRKTSKGQKFKIWFMEHWPIKGMYSLKTLYSQKISEAQKSIRIVTPYFTPPRWFVALIDGAIRRGVKVEIIIPKKTDLPIVDRINHRHIYNLSLLGVHFYMPKEMNHAKIFIIDNREGLIGSQNIDFLSFSFNAESGVFFKQKNLVQELKKITDRWKNEADLFIPRNYKMNFIDYLMLPVVKIIYHLL